jgi:hypothetical protein
MVSIKVILTMLFMTAIMPSCKAMLKSVREVYLDLGTNLGDHVKTKITNILRTVDVEIHNYNSESDFLLSSRRMSLVVSLGNSSSSIVGKHMKNIPPEGFVVSYGMINGETPIISANGNPMASHMHPNSSVPKEWVHYGAIVGAYHVLEILGFGFMHPLTVHTPERIVLNITDFELQTVLIEKPYWPERNFHIHTQHPLELTEVLQGMDVPLAGPLYSNCTANHATADPGRHEGIYCERWEDMVPDVDMMFQWSVANRLNKVEWLLLGNYKWGAFDASDLRQKRLRVLTTLGHQYGLLVGADVPLGNTQQHSWYMVNTRLPFAKQVFISDCFRAPTSQVTTPLLLSYHIRHMA